MRIKGDASAENRCCATLYLMDPCSHPKKPGMKRCLVCNAQYFREYRKTYEKLSIGNARRDGFAEGLKVARVAMLEAGDTQMTGFAAAEMVRKLSAD